MVTLYRAVSELEKQDYDYYGSLRTGQNTLEAKQFFKSRDAIDYFVPSAVHQGYLPPYAYLFTIYIDEACFNALDLIHMQLDGYDAINVHEDFLPALNQCINFVTQDLL